MKITVDAKVLVDVPENWDKMTDKEKLSFIQRHQDNRIVVLVVKI